MKKNLMIVSFAFIFLLSLSIVSAGITGYLVTRGGGIAEAGTTATLQGVRDGVATIAVTTKAGDTQVVRVREGETATVGNAQISASSLTKGTLFTRGKANVEINVAPVGIGSSGLLSVTEEECSENCQTFTEVYKVEEGQQISINGDTISIDFINANQIKLDVNGQITPLLNEGNTFELSDGKIVVVKNVIKLEVAGEIGWVELGVLSSYKLEEGQQISIVGEVISIDFINANQVMLDVNGQITSLLNEGNTFKLSNGQIVTIQDVIKLEVAGEIGWVVLDPSSCYFPYF